MAQPATGVSFKASGLAYVDPSRIRRGGRWQLAVRDYNGSDTNISPGSAFGAPMAADGLWRDDLFAVKKVNGRWVYNNNANLGYYPIGSQHPDGIERTSKVDSDPLEILQSLDPARVDLQKRERSLVFTPREHVPWIDLIQFNRPLVNVLEGGAASTYFASESSDPEFVERQVLVMHEDTIGGKVERNCFPFARCNLTDLGSQKGNKKDVDETKLTLTRLIDPWFTDADGVPLIDGRWTTGDLWDDAFTPGFTFTHDAPVGTANTATTASLVFPKLLGGSGSLTYTVQKSASAAFTSPSSVTVGSTSGTDTITLSLTGLTTSTTSYLRVTATDSTTPVALTAVSKISNPVTQP